MNFQTFSQGICAVNVCFRAFGADKHKIWATMPSYYRGKGPFNQNIENKCSHIFPSPLNASLFFHLHSSFLLIPPPLPSPYLTFPSLLICKHGGMLSPQKGKFNRARRSWKKCHSAPVLGRRRRRLRHRGRAELIRQGAGGKTP